MSFCGGKTKQYTDNPKWFDPLGPAGTTGGAEQRARIFGEMSLAAPKMFDDAQASATRARRAANDPAWGQARQYATQLLQGKYLSGSPQLDAAMNALHSRAAASAADQEARTQANWGRAGMGFSTANQQAAQANRAAATAQANATEAATRLQNYQTERGYQNAATELLKSASSAPLEYLQAAANAYMAPLLQQAQLVKTLAGDGQIVTPQSTYVKKPGAFDYVTGAANAIMPDSV